MATAWQFGEQVEGFRIPVLNEREIRGAAGLLFFATFLSLMFILLRGNFVPIKFVISAFLADFLIRVFVSPRFSPTLILSRWVVRNQVPEYVSAAPKKLAWLIGVALSGTMFVLMVLMNTFSVVTGIICLICLVFLFFESVFGICLGCKMYALVYRQPPELCPGEVCDVRSRHAIQRTSPAQVLVLCAFVACVVAGGIVLRDTFAVPPRPLFGGAPTTQAGR